MSTSRLHWRERGNGSTRQTAEALFEILWGDRIRAALNQNV